jgi:hypothetical protein
MRPACVTCSLACLAGRLLRVRAPAELRAGRVHHAAGGVAIRRRASSAQVAAAVALLDRGEVRAEY